MAKVFQESSTGNNCDLLLFKKSKRGNNMDKKVIKPSFRKVSQVLKTLLSTYLIPALLKRYKYTPNTSYMWMLQSTGGLKYICKCFTISFQGKKTLKSRPKDMISQSEKPIIFQAIAKETFSHLSPSSLQVLDDFFASTLWQFSHQDQNLICWKIILLYCQCFCGSVLSYS